MRQQFDLPYSTSGGVSLGFDFFHPDPTQALPLVICIHGGGWISGEKNNMHEVAMSLAQRGFAAACPSYRLAPLHPFPAPVEDMRALVRFFRANAEEYKIRPDQIVSLGNSAGGHLALMLGLTDIDNSRTNAIVDICGITNLAEPRENHFPISWSFVDQFMGNASFETNPEIFDEASPVYFVDRESVPCCILHGEADDIVPIEQSAELERAYRTQGRPVEFHRFAGEGHSFSYPAWLEVEQLYLDFLCRTLDLPVVEKDPTSQLNS